MFTVVADQHSAAISVQAVDDAGYSLPIHQRSDYIIQYTKIDCYEGHS